MKIPSLFRKKYSGKQFQARIIKKIHIPKDRELVLRLFKKSAEGMWEPVEDVPQEDLPRLKPLAKAIKKNRGLVSRWKASVVLIIAGGVVAFNLIFKDRLAGQAVESVLEGIFQGEATLENPRFSFFGGSFSYRTLTIADADDGRKNLIETGPAELRINLGELLKRRFRIEEASLTGLRWGTPREGGDLLPQEADSAGEGLSGKKPSAEKGGVSVIPGREDLQALLEAQKENLETLALIDRGKEEVEAFIEEWSAIYARQKRELEGLSEDILSLKEIDIQDIGSLEDGMALIGRVDNTYTRVAAKKDELLELRNRFEEDGRSLMDLGEAIPEVFEADLDYLMGFLDFSSGALRALFSGAVEIYLRNRWNGYYEAGLKALSVYDRYKSKASREKAGKKRPRRDRGRTIPFPAPEQPGFVMDHFMISGGDEEGDRLKLELRNLTNEPDKLGRPLTFLADWEGEASLGLNGKVDLRSSADPSFEMEIFSPGNPLVLQEGIPALQVNRISGKADVIGVSRSSGKDETLLFSLDIVLTDIKISQPPGESPIAGAVRGIFSDLEEVNLNAEILIGREGVEEVEVSTDLDDILADRVGDYLKEQAALVEEELKEELSDFLAPYLEENEALEAALETVGLESLEQISSMEALERLVEDRRAELENQTEAIRKRIEAEARRLVGEEVEKRTEEAAERVGDEAEKLLKEAAEKIKFPGF